MKPAASKVPRAMASKLRWEMMFMASLIVLPVGQVASHLLAWHALQVKTT